MSAQAAASPSLETRLGPLSLKNPVTVASGCYGYGANYREFYDPAELGGVMLKCVTPGERPGNAPQRLVETPSGLLNAIGLQNVGLDNFISGKLDDIRDVDTVFFANIGAESLEEYADLSRTLSALDEIDAIELNISCPNVKKGCIQFGATPEGVKSATEASVQASSKPVFVKLSPNVGDIGAMARAAEEGGAHGLSVINTLLGMAIDIETRRPKLGNYTGGLSGPAIRPVAVRMVWECRKATSLPIIGMGGIMNAGDAVEFLLAGASAISVGTANFVDPMAPIQIRDGIVSYMREKGFATIDELSGAMES